ncbi:MAG: hypothetical protein U9O56_01365 [Campylobacterota bacterium]|nr:hypothetical protein [Campylobacterota bacterium]
MTESQKTNLTQLVYKYYTRKSIVNIVTSYILYYQVTLGDHVFSTSFDVEQTIKKVKELNLTLHPNDIIMIVMNMIVKHSNEPDFDDNFEQYLRDSAILHSLSDFVNNDKDLLNKDYFFKTREKEILENRYFDTKLKMRYIEEYPKMFTQYNNKIDDEYSLKVQEILIANFINL